MELNVYSAGVIALIAIIIREFIAGLSANEDTSRYPRKKRRIERRPSTLDLAKEDARRELQNRIELRVARLVQDT